MLPWLTDYSANRPHSTLGRQAAAQPHHRLQALEATTASETSDPEPGFAPTQAQSENGGQPPWQRHLGYGSPRFRLQRTLRHDLLPQVQDAAHRCLRHQTMSLVVQRI